MKISIIQFIIAICLLSISSAYQANAQEILNRKITVKATNDKLKTILNQIEKIGNVKFFYSPQVINSRQKVSIDVNGQSLSITLEKLLSPLNIEYLLSGNQIILKQKEVLIKTLESKKNYYQTNTSPDVKLKTITGLVTNKKNESLPGVNVRIKGLNKGTVTDINGNFSLEVLSDNAILVFSFIGYFSKEVIFVNQTTFEIVLEEDAAALDEIVVTGVFDKRTRMESSVAISTLNSKQIDRIVAGSAADLLKNIPGVFVNSSLGEIRNTVYSRGVSVGSNDGASGYYYVSMQEDGLPVTNATYGNYGPDYFLRVDATLAKLEAVRGGTASILGNNAPGGIFNYVSKTGGQAFTGDIRARFGLEGNGKNPFYRTDMNFGGPLNKDKSLTYNIGGFLRQSDGARYPGYPMNNGGQVKANISKIYTTGSLKVYGKMLNDHNAWFEFLPTIGFTDPQLPTGVSQTNTVLIPSVISDFTINETGEKRHYNSRDKINSKDNAIGLNWEQCLGEGWAIDNKLRYSSKITTWNTTAVAYPFAADRPLFYAIPGLLGQFGTYNFADQSTGNIFGTIIQAPNIINESLVGYNFIDQGSNFPGASIQKNSLFFNPCFFMENNMREIIDQFTITKKLENMSLTVGMFYANSVLNRLNSQGAGITFTQMNSPRPALTKITLVGSNGNTYQVTNADGVIGGAGSSVAVNIQDATQNQAAVFLGHNWAFNPKLNFDWGVRYEKVGYMGTNQVAVTVPSTSGGTDGNLLTLYDNTSGKIGATYTYTDKKVSTVSFSAGLNYKYANNQAIYARFSEGNKAPDLDMFINVNTVFGAANLNPIAQKVQQVEIGYKLKSSNTNLFITPFFSILSNVPQQTIGRETADLASTYALPILYNKITTKGIEIESNHNFAKDFNLRAVATFQQSIATNFKTWIVGENGNADDVIQDFSGNDTDNNARIILRLSPTYNKGKLYSSLDLSYMGKRAANVPNAFSLPAFSQTNLNIAYNLNLKLQLQANINNIFNQNGIMGWSAPGGFPAALDRQGFTKARLEANPNAVYSTLSLPPRAYFITASYKF